MLQRILCGSHIGLESVPPLYYVSCSGFERKKTSLINCLRQITNEKFEYLIYLYFDQALIYLLSNHLGSIYLLSNHFRVIYLLSNVCH